ncbi:MAG TPA: palindromic element RPE4 domain-containing protein [Rickettsia endosymbiont of Omalisus fontisbellaquei]|nr:palindromic element RPE4 domain-containing protein [Rickettsia endosymbiont of Omalisus fontisbellaquei]
MFFLDTVVKPRYDTECFFIFTQQHQLDHGTLFSSVIFSSVS